MARLSPSYLAGRTVLISYPKSGRTWLRYIFNLMSLDVVFSHAGHGTGGSHNIGRAFAGCKKTVLGRKTLFLHRNVLDTCVSYYFQIHRTDLVPGAFDFERKVDRLSREHRLPPRDIGEFVCHPIWGVENICRFNRAWLDYFSGRPDSLIVSYDQIRADPETHLPALLDFVGAPEYHLEEVVKRSSFETMRTLELTGANEGLRLYGMRQGDPESLKLRKGRVRGYVQYLTKDVISDAAATAATYGLTI